MGNDLSKNTLIGLTHDDTPANLSAIIMLLKNLRFDGDINEHAEHGLFLIHTLIEHSLEYEISRAHKRKHNAGSEAKRTKY